MMRYVSIRSSVSVAVAILALVVTIVSSAWGADNAMAVPGSGEAWYKIVTGILAIPATLIGFVVTINTLRKTTLESRKLELEIREKQMSMSRATPGEGRLDDITRPITDSQRALLLVVRYVVLELTLKLWNFVPFVVGYITESVPWMFLLGAQQHWFPTDLKPTSPLVISAFIIPKIIDLGFHIVYWFIVFGFGWPLLKDTFNFLNIPINGLFDLPWLGRANSIEVENVSTPTLGPDT
jgi:hypothetical protein